VFKLRFASTLRLRASFALVTFLLCIYGLNGQVRQNLQRYDQASRDRGKTGFGAACAFCHGANARGGEGGPDLLHSVVVLQDESGTQLGAFLQKGRPDKGMPAFTALKQEQATDIATYLHAEVLAAVSQRNVQIDIVTGNAKRGEEFFNGEGKCTTCHSITDDLKGIGSKYEPIVLQDKAMSPRGPAMFGNPAPGAQPIATITLPSGEVVTGAVLRMNLFNITIRDAKGTRRTFARDGDAPKVDVRDPLQAHIDNLLKMTDQHMRDLTAYLVTLK
jgi:cytochrome c oxidase cbb3-type subunit 3